jgi:hypothetical protein
MNLRGLRNIALAVFVILGLSLAPFGAPALSVASPIADALDTSMPAEMPCCPDEQKSKSCVDCPLIAICILKTTQADLSTTAALPLRHAVRTTHSLRQDVFVAELNRPPPDHPPRNLA